jgi:hypothetical protein
MAQNPFGALSNNDFITQLLGTAPDYSESIGAAQQKRLVDNAQQQAMLNGVIALLGLSGPQRQQVGTGQALGAALGAGVGGYNESMDRTLKQALTGMQLQEYTAKRAREDAMRKGMASAITSTPQLTPMARTPGSQLEMLSRPEFGGEMAVPETIGALMSNPNLPQVKSVNQDRLLATLAEYDPVKYAELTAKAAKEPGKVQEYQFAQTPAGGNYKGTFSDFIAGGTAKTIINMAEGQKGFENEMKLKDAFRSEPIYKAHAEMQSAYNQIQDSIQQASPAGDLAAATKFMKILDPGSVVRESELAMAMKASGALDRAVNYAQLTLSGQKLTPTQRKDFKDLSDKLMSTATTTYNQRRSELVKQGTDYGLNAERALGEPAKLPTKNIKVNY